jgi:hypothetical protein
VAITLIATYPLWTHLADAIPGGGDSWLYYWNLWWVKRAIADLHTSPFFTPELYHPYGAALYFHTLNFFGDILVLPLMHVVSIAAAYNTLVLASFILSGYAVYRLALAIVGASAYREAFLAGVAFMCSSYRLAHLVGHLDLVSTQWLAWYALCLTRTRRDGGWLAPLAGGATLAACGLTTPYYLLFALMLAGLVAVHAAVTEEPPGRGIAVARVASTVVIGAVAMSPMLLPMLTRSAEGRVLDPAADAVRFSADVLAFVTPSPEHPWWGGMARHLQNAIQPSGFTIENVVYVGIVPLWLAALARDPRPARRFWTVVALVFGVLALGPTLRVGGYTVPIVSGVMPYRWLARLPYGEIPRVPARFAVLTLLAMSLLAAMGARALFARRRVSTPLYFALLGVMVLDTTIVPLPLNRIEAPPFFSWLAADPTRGALVEVPIPDDPAIFPWRMLWQTIRQACFRRVPRTRAAAAAIRGDSRIWPVHERNRRARRRHPVRHRAASRSQRRRAQRLRRRDHRCRKAADATGRRNARATDRRSDRRCSRTNLRGRHCRRVSRAADADTDVAGHVAGSRLVVPRAARRRPLAVDGRLSAYRSRRTACGNGVSGVRSACIWNAAAHPCSCGSRYRRRANDPDVRRHVRDAAIRRRRRNNVAVDRQHRWIVHPAGRSAAIVDRRVRAHGHRAGRPGCVPLAHNTVMPSAASTRAWPSSPTVRNAPGWPAVDVCQ